MKRLVLALALVGGLAVPAWADFRDGVKAYNRGDYAAALREWKPLAEQGDGDAQNNLAILYDEGNGIAQDQAEAAKWYGKAAAQGKTDAQNNLGVLYERGIGVKRDPVQAHKWYSIAASLGNDAARENLEAVAKTMNGEQIARAKGLARRWRSGKQAQ